MASKENQDGIYENLGWRFEDIENNTKDCTIASWGVSARIFKGDIENGVHKANLQELATCRDAVFMSLRALYRNLLFKDYSEVLYFNLAKECGMINYGTIISSTSVAIDFEELDDNMTWEEFSKIVRTILYIPKTVTAYGGYINQYYIDDWKKGYRE